MAIHASTASNDFAVNCQPPPPRRRCPRTISRYLLLTIIPSANYQHPLHSTHYIVADSGTAHKDSILTRIFVHTTKLTGSEAKPVNKAFPSAKTGLRREYGGIKHSADITPAASIPITTLSNEETSWNWHVLNKNLCRYRGATFGVMKTYVSIQSLPPAARTRATSAGDKAVSP
jgi:hypothetical protein